MIMLTKLFLEITRPPMPPSDASANPATEWSAPPVAWSGVQDPFLPAARTEQDKLELLQWVAFVTMFIDHLGFFGPALWGSEPVVLRFIGRLSFPLFALVFAWRLARITWSDPRRDFTGQLFKLMVCALATQLAWEFSGAELLINPVMGFGAALGIVVLLQEDRLGYIQNLPLGVRLFLSTLLALWVHQHVDYGLAGLFMTLSAYASIRFADEAAKVVGLVCLFVLTACHPVHGAFLALPLAWWVINGRWGVKKPVANLFYWLYPLHILALGWLVRSVTP